ncbi:hypothetical protein SSX86_010938 [Deinandra increscens subsp. villosa]|uniref:Nucleic acid-binding protein n=1 Tax=Deinandra increscens subsp. villosa TaxID=3103831 RepID=A0AAP0D9V9_9ASTR
MEIINVADITKDTRGTPIEIRVGDAIQIHAVSSYKNAHRHQLELLGCYRISSYICAGPPSYLKLIDHPVSLKIGAPVVATPINDSRIYPTTYFQFKDYDDLVPSDPNVDIITDYIGILERIEDGETKFGETKFHDPFVRLTLKNLRGNRIRVSLWKEIIISLEMFDREALDHASQRCIIAVAAVKVLKPQGWLQLNSTAATFVYINPDIEAASNMLAGYYLTTTVSDSTASATAVIFYEAACTLVGKPCSELVVTEGYTDNDHIPPALLAVKEQTFLFYMKVQFYTRAGITNFTVNRIDPIGSASTSISPQTQNPKPNEPRPDPSTGVKRSIQDAIGGLANFSWSFIYTLVFLSS